MRNITECFNGALTTDKVSRDEMDISLLQFAEKLIILLLSDPINKTNTNFKIISDSMTLFFGNNQAYIFFRQGNDEFYLKVSCYAIQLSQNKIDVVSDRDVVKSIVYSMLDDIINIPSTKTAWNGDIQFTLRDWGHYAEVSTILLKLWC